MARVLIPLPDTDFDVTEVAVPWRLLTRAGHEVVFVTEDGGNRPQADPLLLDGVIFGKLGAEPEAIAYYRELEDDPNFGNPGSWNATTFDDFDALLLPGGHAPGMKQYLGCEPLQDKIAAFAATGRPLGAICHGVVVLARSTDPDTGKSVLAERKTTCLPKYMERTAYFLTFWKLGRYYRTYDLYVEDEVKSQLGDPDQQFVRGPRNLTRRGTEDDDSGAFVVEDGNYVSARWPGDAYLFARKLIERLG